MLACLSADALRPAVAPMADAPVPVPLSPALEMLFGTVHELVLKLETAPEGHATLRDIGLVIGRVLDLLEEDQAILGAADHLYEAALQGQAASVRSGNGASCRDPSRGPPSCSGRISEKPLLRQAECERTGTGVGVVKWNLLGCRSGEKQTDQGRSRPKNGMVRQG